MRRKVLAHRPRKLLEMLACASIVRRGSASQYSATWPKVFMASARSSEKLDFILPFSTGLTIAASALPPCAMALVRLSAILSKLGPRSELGPEKPAGPEAGFSVERTAAAACGGGGGDATGFTGATGGCVRFIA